MFSTDEGRDAYAQWQHDTAWQTPEAIDSDVIRQGDIVDCVHIDATVHAYNEKSGWEFKVWDCPDCGKVGEIGKES